MSTERPAIQPADQNDVAHAGADVKAVLDRFGSGKPLDPAVSERIRAQSERVTEGIRRDCGLVDDETFQSLLDDEA
jgi:hypothetical protein